MPTAKNGFQIRNLHPKNIYFKIKSTFLLNANLLEKFRFLGCRIRIVNLFIFGGRI